MRRDPVRLVRANGRIRRRSWFRSWSFEQVLVRRAGGRHSCGQAVLPRLSERYRLDGYRSGLGWQLWVRFGLGRLFGLFGGGVTIRG